MARQTRDKAVGPLLVLVGMAGSGKSTVAAHLERRGWQRITFGDLTREELDRRGQPHVQRHERAVREELRHRHGPAAYAELLLPRIEAAVARGPTVVDGLYSWAEYRYLKQHLAIPLEVVAVAAERRHRYARLAERPRRGLSAREAEDRDVTELETLDKGGPIAMADYTLLNDGSPEELIAQVEALLARIGAGADAAAAGAARGRKTSADG